MSYSYNRQTKYYFILFFLFLSFNLFSDTTYANPKETTAIEEQIKKYVKGWNSQDGKAFSESFSENSSFVNIFAMKISGKESIAKRHQEVLSGFLKGTILATDRVDIRFVADNLAIVLVDWTLSHLKCQPQQPCPQKGVFTHTLYKRANGDWLIEATQNTMQPKSQL